ncbi:MAG: DUF5668 domain-containing protein [Patescibacteria group bacterium]
MLIGVLLLLIGALLLLQNLGYITGDIWSYFWPVLLILIGLSMMVKTSRRK